MTGRINTCLRRASYQPGWLAQMAVLLASSSTKLKYYNHYYFIKKYFYITDITLQDGEFSAAVRSTSSTADTILVNYFDQFCNVLHHVVTKLKMWIMARVYKQFKLFIFFDISHGESLDASDQYLCSPVLSVLNSWLCARIIYALLCALNMATDDILVQDWHKVVNMYQRSKGHTWMVGEHRRRHWNS